MSELERPPVPVLDELLVVTVAEPPKGMGDGWWGRWPRRVMVDQYGYVVRAEPRCDAICDESGGGSCFTPWCRCSCHQHPPARRADWVRSYAEGTW